MNQRNAFFYLQQLKEQLLPEFKDPGLCESYAWQLLEKACNVTKTELIVATEILFTPQQQALLAEWIDLLINKHMPIQYILGSVPFNDLDILVEPPILIPRPETEEWVINLVEKLKCFTNTNLNILDIGTGSGCIALTCAYHLPRSHVVAVDISPVSLRLAQKNMIHNSIKNVTFVMSNLFNHIQNQIKFDLIVSNPPYIAFSERDSLEPSVIEWEDEGALCAHDDGLAIIKKIIDDAPLYLKPNDEMKAHVIPQVVLEIGHQQGSLVKNYMIAAGYNEVHIYKDMGQKDRVVVGRIDNVATANTRK